MLDKIKRRWNCLQEVWQRGYSWDYRMYRLREAFGLPNEDKLDKQINFHSWN